MEYTRIVEYYTHVSLRTNDFIIVLQWVETEAVKTTKRNLLKGWKYVSRAVEKKVD